MNIDDKLESIFVYLQDMRLTNQRLLKVEQTVREHDHTRVRGLVKNNWALPYNIYFK